MAGMAEDDKRGWRRDQQGPEEQAVTGSDPAVGRGASGLWPVEMLWMGIIEPSHSAWRSPVVLVPKPDGSIQFCIDYWGVNTLAKFDTYPMPRADILIDQLGTAHYLSALNLTKVYWQVPVHPPDRKKTVFTTSQGLYQFIRMPFGLHGAASTFQHLVD